LPGWSTRRYRHDAPLWTLVLGLILVALYLPSGASAAECTNTWIGPSEGNWATAEGWSKGSVPASTDVACVGAGKSLVVNSGSYEVGVVQGEGALALVSTLRLESSTEASGIGALSMWGEALLTGPGDLEIAEELLYTNANRMSGAGSTVILPGAVVKTALVANPILEGRLFVNEGTFDQSRGTIVERSGAEFLNLGTFNAKEGSLNLFEYTGESRFVNRCGGSASGLGSL
jgi:hypothetical protein